jgi:hypothetical protein
MRSIKSIELKYLRMKHFITGLLLLAFCLNTYSQGYEIRIIHKGGGVLGIQMRMTGSAAPANSDYITDIVFGIKWNTTANAELNNNITGSYNIKKAGPRGSKGVYHFQAFYSDPIGFTFPESWTTGSWSEIAAVTINQPAATGGTFELCEQGFDITTTPNFGVNFTDFMPVLTGGAANVALPVKMSKFEALPRETFIQLQWTTDMESNNKGFELQRSQDMSNFTPIGWVDGKGNTNTPSNYAFQDRQVLAGIKYYYRIKQVDFDGRESISSIKQAQLKETGSADMLISPNPAQKILHVQFRSRDLTGLTNLKVFTATGEKLVENNTMVSPGSGYDIQVGHLPQGTYYLVASQGEKIWYQKVFQKL